jgi:cytochrome b
MSIRSNAGPGGSTTLPAAPAAAPAMIPVWDPLVRAFHWSLVVLFVAAYATAEDAEALHRFIGYGIAALLAARVVWGFIGSRHARFTDFVRSPRAVLAYLKLAGTHRAPRYLGHNPAGGAMTIALMAMIGGICWTGHLMTTSSGWGSEVLEGVHALLANGTIVLIALHLVGNLLSSLLHRENLTMSMITGLKRPWVRVTPASGRNDPGRGRQSSWCAKHAPAKAGVAPSAPRVADRG